MSRWDHARTGERSRRVVALAALLAIAAGGCGGMRLHGSALVDPTVAGGEWPCVLPAVPSIGEHILAATDPREYDWSGYYALGVLPGTSLGRSGIAADFVAERRGWELASVGSDVANGASEVISWTTAHAHLHDPALGTEATETRFDVGIGLCLVPNRWLSPRVEAGGSFLWLDMDGADRDTLGMGVFARAAVLVRIWRNLEVEVHGDVHGWLGIDDHDFVGVEEKSFGYRIAYSFLEVW